MACESESNPSQMNQSQTNIKSNQNQIIKPNQIVLQFNQELANQNEI